MTPHKTRPGPDFMCIGAQKAGTTWLYENLKRHPQVWFPPIKEFHYFDEIERGVKTDLRSRLTDRHWANRWWRQRFAGCVGRSLTHLRPRELAWHIRYFTFPRSMDWYERLFAGCPKGRVTGDITPDYTLLGPALVRDIVDRFPRLKVVFLMRDPIERQLSGLRMWLARQDAEDKPTEADLAKRIHGPLNDPETRRLGDYMTTIDTWEQCLPTEQIFYGFFDELQASPAALLARITAFLGISEPDELARDESESVHNKGPTLALPVGMEDELASSYLGGLEALAARFSCANPNYPARWLERAQRACLAVE